MTLTRRSVNWGLAATLTAPAILRRARADDSTIKIGMVLPVTGPAADNGKYSLTGAKIALDRVNKAGGVLGKQLELVTEDDQTTNPGAVLAFSKLAAQPDIVAFIGSIRSTQNHAMAPDILKTGKPVCFGGTDPTLTKMGNPWLLRFRPNDTYSGRVIASYGVETLGKKNWAIVHSTDAFGVGGFNALSASLDKLGAKVALDQGYPNQSQDFTPVVLAIKSSDADVIGSYFDFRQRRRDLRAAIAAARRDPTLGRIALDRRRRRGEARRPRALGHLRRRRLRRRIRAPRRRNSPELYGAVSKASPDIYSSWTYDAVGVLCAAINKAGSTDPGKIREAILSTKGYKGAEGEYNFDQYGDGLHGYNIVRNEKGTIVFDKHIEFTD